MDQHHGGTALLDGRADVSDAAAAAPTGEHQPGYRRPAPATRPTVLRFGGVTHRYGSHLALNGLDLSVSAGETVALLGPNGAGKSTTIAAMLGLVQPQEGTVEVLGLDPRAAVAAGRVGAMLQTGSGCGLPPGVRIAQALRLVGRLYPRPSSLATVVARADIANLLDRRTDRLSGGQAQRVRFALAIAGDPEVVFLDEPTSAMDIEARRRFWRVITDLGREGKTILFATHHLAEADQVADRVVVLDRGCVVADGPGATLKAAVGGRTVRFGCARSGRVAFDRLDAVTAVDVRGETVILSSRDADATVRCLVASGTAFQDLEVLGPCLEEAYEALTGRRQATSGPSR